MTHEELKDLIITSLEHDEQENDEVWFSRTAREAMLRELEKLARIKIIVNYEVGNRHEIGDKILDVIDGGDEE